MTATVYKNYIDGHWVPSSSGQTFENRNPANTDDLIGVFQQSSGDDVRAAIDAAARAYERWRLVPAPKRAEILFKAAQLIVERKEQFARDMTREMGKVLNETRGDVQEAIDMTFYMAGEGRRMFGQTVPSELRNKFAMSVRQPLGVCSIITPWNFPMAIPSWKIIPALVCGNTVVFKPASQTPLSALNFVNVLTEAGVPPGVVNFVTGDGEEVGTPMTTDPRVRVVSFTGSTHVGRIVNQAAAPTFKKVHLEMGGKNVIIIMDDADLELAVDGCLWGGFGTTGQRCTAASRVVVHEKVYRRFVEEFVSRAKSLKVGDGLQADVEMGPSNSESQLGTVMKYVKIGRDEGAKLATGGGRLETGAWAKGYFHEPTVFTDVDPKMRIAREEIFGPVVSVIPCRSLEQAIEIGNSVEYGLSASIYTQDINRAFAAMRDLYTGIFYVNAPTIGAEVHLPFGGTKHTGNGHREAGVAA
ncbi:MAG TPA: aldehyde dehydrogenase family protein, partial [Vicinamibacterales bacterium]|nr:aldehyde dehydrogenase family protein [Vicinamibacterales bacterium]